MVVLIDNGHGYNTPGKCSPDNRIKEWKWNRIVADQLQDELKSMGINAEMLVLENDDIALAERVRRANKICAKVGVANALLVSIHVNAAGNGTEWKSARGWRVYTAPKCSDRSHTLAKCINDECCTVDELRAVKSTPWRDGDYRILRDSKCAAVLTENLFMDNIEDVQLLLDPDIIQKIVHCHAQGIKKYIYQIDRR